MSIRTWELLRAQLQALSVSSTITLWDTGDFVNISPDTVVQPQRSGTVGAGRTTSVESRQDALDRLALALTEVGAVVRPVNEAPPLDAPAPGKVRLWRIERPLRKVEGFDREGVTDWSAEPANKGRWFSNSLDLIATYLRPPTSLIPGLLMYVDVDRDVAEEARVINQPPSIQRQVRSGAGLDELYLPEAIASQTQMAPAHVMSHSLLPGQQAIMQGMFGSGLHIFEVLIESGPPLHLTVEYATNPFGDVPVAKWFDESGNDTSADRDYLCATLQVPLNNRNWIQVQVGAEPLDNALLRKRMLAVRSQPQIRVFSVLTDELSKANVKWAITGGWSAHLRGESQDNRDLMSLEVGLAPSHENVCNVAKIITYMNDASSDHLPVMREIEASDGFNTTIDGIAVHFYVLSASRWSNIQNNGIESSHGVWPVLVETGSSLKPVEASLIL